MTSPCSPHRIPMPRRGMPSSRSASCATRPRAAADAATRAAHRRVSPREVDAELVVLDPALPVGLLGPRLGVPYGLVLHGAEVTVPGRLPVSQQVMRSVLRGARVIVAAGGYPAFEARASRAAVPSRSSCPARCRRERFRPLDATERADVRERFGLDPGGRLIVGVSRLVPRKGFDTLIRAASRLAATRADLEVAIAGGGRDRQRLERLARRTASAGAVPRVVCPTPTCPRCTGLPTSSRCCAATVGEGSSKRASGSSSSKRPRAEFHRSRGTAAAPTKR